MNESYGEQIRDRLVLPVVILSIKDKKKIPPSIVDQCLESLDEIVQITKQMDKEEQMMISDHVEIRPNTREGIQMANSKGLISFETMCDKLRELNEREAENELS